MGGAGDRPRAGLAAVATVVGLCCPGLALASSFGVGLGGSYDLPDAKQDEQRTRIDLGGLLVLPARIDVGPSVAVRTTFEVGVARGTDTLSWQVGDERVGVENAALFGAGTLLVGPEVALRGDRGWWPYFGVSVGPSLVVTGHSKMTDRHDLFDPAEYSTADLGDPSTVDPFSRQVVLASQLTAGIATDLLWAELGYGGSYLPAGELRRGTPGIGLRREAYGWNALRLVVGVAASFGRPAE
ncbi:MAG: hypothetical protein R3F59_01685 [Myxococcota bacterium]